MKILELNAYLKKNIKFVVSFTCEHLKNVNSQVLKNDISNYTVVFSRITIEYNKKNLSLPRSCRSYQSNNYIFQSYM